MATAGTVSERPGAENRRTMFMRAWWLLLCEAIAISVANAQRLLKSVELECFAQVFRFVVARRRQLLCVQQPSLLQQRRQVLSSLCVAEQRCFWRAHWRPAGLQLSANSHCRPQQTNGPLCFAHSAVPDSEAEQLHRRKASEDARGGNGANGWCTSILEKITEFNSVRLLEQWRVPTLRAH